VLAAGPRGVYGEAVPVRDDRLAALLGPGAPVVVAIFDALPDAIGAVWPVTGAAGEIIDFEVGYTNPSAARMMGVPLNREAGARLRDVMPGLVELGVYDRLVAVTETGQGDTAELELDVLWRDALHVRGIWVHSVLPFGAGVLSVAFDITEARRREQELRDFAIVAAHDLREPLVGMHLLSSLLTRREGFGDREREMLALLDAGSATALSLVNSILEYADAGPGGEHATVDCGAVVADVVRTLGPQIEGAAGRIEVAPLPTLPASRAGMSRLFQNLIANAIKFRAQAAPVVRISAAPHETGWAFAVTDNGVGLPDGSAIFEMFTRGGGEQEGSGIGLATCRRIVEGHGGRIWAEPAPGGGSTFSFTLTA
jgi:signal transduction histidine kinase